jgi:hypothetical protein
MTVQTDTAAEVDAQAPYVLVARYKKARLIAKSLLALGATAESAAHLGKFEDGRRLAAAAAGTHVPSPVTWMLVVELVREVRP